MNKIFIIFLSSLGLLSCSTNKKNTTHSSLEASSKQEDLTLDILHSKDLAFEVLTEIEFFLSAIKSEPTLRELRNPESHPPELYIELVRRVSLINNNWEYQARGLFEANKSQFSIIIPPNCSDLDHAYLSLLKSEMGVEILSLPNNLSKYCAKFYMYGYNNRQLKKVLMQYKESELIDLHTEAYLLLGYKGATLNSVFFLPNRFVEEFTLNSKGTDKTKIPPKQSYPGILEPNQS